MKPDSEDIVIVTLLLEIFFNSLFTTRYILIILLQFNNFF